MSSLKKISKTKEEIIEQGSSFIVHNYLNNVTLPDILNSDWFQTYLKVNKDIEEVQQLASENKMFEKIGKYEYYKNQVRLTVIVFKNNCQLNSKNHFEKSEAIHILKNRLNQSIESAQFYFQSAIDFDFIKMKGDVSFIVRDAKIRKS